MLARSVLLSPSERSTLFAHILRLALANGALLCAGAQRPSAPSGSVQQEASSSPKLAAGAIIGIGIGIAVFLTVVATLVFLVVRRRRRKSRDYAMMPESSGRGRTNHMHGTRHSQSPVASATGGLAAIRPVLLLGSSITGVPR
ncbi:hypothetical protein PC9H_006954 [Pleurotus ostreatus]|uniref:Uncharacterized protein n=1 Tax=Pleurotus ostreatus TaxID=5322 RepID=A0A8H6ZXY0_PLEOS|nr:uncharacterized protein PC9H_006954 [Pleurotus ostreatus]KAF7431233.1 hypothetical protein PC9H_006954 [Pleurotus ostreatus]